MGVIVTVGVIVGVKVTVGVRVMVKVGVTVGVRVTVGVGVGMEKSTTQFRLGVSSARGFSGAVGASGWKRNWAILKAVKRIRTVKKTVPAIISIFLKVIVFSVIIFISTQAGD